MSRILLIKCSDITNYRNLEFKPRNIIDKTAHFFLTHYARRFTYAIVPPLGIMYIASTLRRAGHEVRILDLRGIEVKPFSLRTEIERFKPKIIGLSGITTEAESIHSTARIAKETIKNVVVVVGGPHASSYPAETLTDNNIDMCVIGEGEKTVTELVDAIDGGNAPDLEKVKGIAFRKNGEVFFTAERPYIENLDSFPYPAWDLIDLDVYSRIRSMSSVGLRRYMALFTSRACPYRCIYCHNMFGKGFRARSPDNVLQEIEMLNAEYGLREFEILDDIFNADKRRAETIFRKIAALKGRLRFSFPNGLRTDTIDYDMLKTFRDGGVNYISIAVESASERIQKLIKKNLKLDKVFENISLCADLGIFTRGVFMLGFPTETREEILETIDFAERSRLHTAMFFIVIPFQGTELERTYCDHSSPVPYDLHDYFFSTYNLSDVEDMELFYLQSEAIKRFNFNIKRQLMMLKDFPRRRHIWIYGIGLLQHGLLMYHTGRLSWHSKRKGQMVEQQPILK